MQADVLVVGAGPAGIAAACTAAEAGARVVVTDDNWSPGGQIWRNAESSGRGPEARRWIERLRVSGAQIRSGTRVLGPADERTLLAEHNNEPLFIHWRKLVLATGARELLLPFPGWTLPGVTGAGGLQALAKAGVPVAGRRVVVAGSGPLLLAVAAHLRERGAEVLAIAEQAPFRKVAGFLRTVVGSPAKLRQAFLLGVSLAGIPLLTSAWPMAATGNGRLRSVELQTRGGKRSFDCDYLACGFGLVPNIELPVLFGCALREGFVEVDPFQQTSVKDVLCAGEPTGIGGVERSLLEGQIAGYAAAGVPQRAQALFGAREKLHRFSEKLAATFAVRDEIRQLAKPDTIVCRCEDVTWGQISGYPRWRNAKLQTRCGMGACQGRVCRAAAGFLLGRTPLVDHIRPPLFPAPMAVLATLPDDGEDRNG